jgi:hypothetical protein
MRFFKQLVYMAAAVLCLAASQSRADIIFASNPSNPQYGGWIDESAQVFGTPFTVGTSPMSITALGYFDLSGGGLPFAHEVGIYSLARTLLGSVSVPAGTGATLHDGTRWVNLATPIALTADTGYMLAFTVPANDVTRAYDRSDVTIDPHFAPLSSSGYNQKASSSLVYPDGGGWPPNYVFGGNMMEGTSAVPEPAVMLTNGVILLAVGLGAWYFHRRAVMGA